MARIADQSGDAAGQQLFLSQCDLFTQAKALPSSLPGSTGQSILFARLWMRGSSPRMTS
jgi:hypothetical protein